MKIEDFLSQFVEGYLFKDLEHMAAITLEKGEDKGAAGYPMVMTTLSGMELLGALLFQHPLFQNPRRKENGDAHFGGYWRHFLSRTHPKYGTVKGMPELVRNLVRHCLAHSFVAGPGVLVVKGRRDLHLCLDTVKGMLVIDCLQFLDDFKESYQNAVVPIVQGLSYTFGPHTITKNTMQKRLDEMVAAFTQEAGKEFGRLKVKPLRSGSIQFGSAAPSGNFPSPGTTIATIRISNTASGGL